MPITPLHGLAPLFLYFKDRRSVDPLALIVSATFIDLEPLYYFLTGECLDHGIWHGFAISFTVYPVLITFGVFTMEHYFEGRLWSAYNSLRIKPNQVRYSLRRIYISSLIGGVSHVFFDMFTHENMPYVIYPLANRNLFYVGQASIVVEIAVVLLAIYSCLRWLIGYSKGLCASLVLSFPLS